MRLQKQLSRKASGKRYDKWIITVPPKNVKQLGWEAGTPLTSKVNGIELLITKSEDITYEEFKDKIKRLLREENTGLSWEEISAKLKLFQKVPNNIWVRRLTKEIGLQRKRINKKLIWKLGD